MYKKGDKSLTVETKVFELVDLFIRDSTLGQFKTRLTFIKILKQHIKAKVKMSTKTSLKTKATEI